MKHIEFHSEIIFQAIVGLSIWSPGSLTGWKTKTHKGNFYLPERIIYQKHLEREADETREKCTQCSWEAHLRAVLPAATTAWPANGMRPDTHVILA